MVDSTENRLKDAPVRASHFSCSNFKKAPRASRAVPCRVVPRRAALKPLPSEADPAAAPLVDAWRLRRLRSFPTAPISHLQQARWFHTGGPRRVHGKRRDSPHTWAMDFCSAPGLIHACAPAALGRSAQDPSDLCEPQLRL
ncbi:unnamed protein product [Pleuronectes platessa]|uniref:Uncharacterized protein n=1 Tax=Pleuronectes platessa TaxID=8262 RepID=A0A9N7Z8V9_PLEPL|nr:unnamed protein product [Pleuronectes platessa]